MKRRLAAPWITPLVTLLLFAVLVCLSEGLVIRERQHLQEMQYRQVYERAGGVRSQLEMEVNTTLNLSMGLVAFITAQPDSPSDTFQQVAKSIMGQTPHIRNIALARDNVITHMFPLEGNETALGLRYTDRPDQWTAVKKAMDTRKTVVAGPVDLVQGGRAFISRIPIYTHESRYWGLACVAINEETLYRFSGLLGPDPTVRYAIKGKDGLGEKGEVFHGDACLFSDPRAIVLPVDLPGGEWVLAAVPRTGWIEHSTTLTLMRGAGLLLALVIAILVNALLRSYRRIHLVALQDPLTGLSNRRLLEEHLKQLILISRRRKKRFTLLFLDLNRFKPINDRFGHEAGDLVLTTIARRLKTALRESDILARVGGDEFIILCHDMATSTDADAMTEKVARLIEEPVLLADGQTLSVGASIGIGLYPDDGTTADALISHADRAMYGEKRRCV